MTGDQLAEIIRGHADNAVEYAARCPYSFAPDLCGPRHAVFIVDRGASLYEPMMLLLRHPDRSGSVVIGLPTHVVLTLATLHNLECRVAVDHIARHQDDELLVISVIGDLVVASSIERAPSDRLSLS